MQVKVLLLLLGAVFFIDASRPACAGWGSCVACHNGIVAPGKDLLKEKHKTLENFVKAALASTSSMMKHI
jgi:hypothetical protein